MLNTEAQRKGLRELVRELRAAGKITGATTPAQAMAVITAVDQARPEAMISHAEMRAMIDAAEFAALPAANRQFLQMQISGVGIVDLKDAKFLAMLEGMFAVNGATRAAMATRLGEMQSPLTARGLERPSEHQLNVALAAVKAERI